MKLLYRVYDNNLKKFLTENGQRYELKAIDISDLLTKHKEI